MKSDTIFVKLQCPNCGNSQTSPGGREFRFGVEIQCPACDTSSVLIVGNRLYQRTGNERICTKCGLINRITSNYCQCGAGLTRTCVSSSLKGLGTKGCNAAIGVDDRRCDRCNWDQELDPSTKRGRAKLARHWIRTLRSRAPLEEKHSAMYALTLVCGAAPKATTEFLEWWLAQPVPTRQGLRLLSTYNDWTVLIGQLILKTLPVSLDALPSYINRFEQYSEGTRDARFLQRPAELAIEILRRSGSNCARDNLAFYCRALEIRWRSRSAGDGGELSFGGGGEHFPEFVWTGLEYLIRIGASGDQRVIDFVVGHTRLIWNTAQANWNLYPRGDRLARIWLSVCCQEPAWFSRILPDVVNGLVEKCRPTPSSGFFARPSDEDFRHCQDFVEQIPSQFIEAAVQHPSFTATARVKDYLLREARRQRRWSITDRLGLAQPS